MRFPPLHRQLLSKFSGAAVAGAILAGAILAGAIPAGAILAGAAESEKKTAEGLTRVQLITDASAIVPGEPLTVALVLETRPGFHTYWRGPGIVGVAPVIEWKLPPGFTAGPIEWPAPVKVDMAGIVANGFRGEIWLLSRIEVPDTLTEASVSLSAKCAWMVCSSSCHPGIANLEMRLPVESERETVSIDREIADRFARIRETLPPPAPASWEFSVALPRSDRIVLEVSIPELAVPETGLHFFCDDFQVDSDQPEEVEKVSGAPGRFRMILARPDFAPKQPKHLSGLLYSESGWPGIDSRWVEVEVPWPEGTFPDE